MTDQTEHGDYLAGESAGQALQADERAALDRIGHHLKDPGLWEEPASDGQFRLLAAATEESRERNESAENPGESSDDSDPIEQTLPPLRRVAPLPGVATGGGGATTAGFTPGPAVDPTDTGDDGVVQLLDRRRSRQSRGAWFGAGAVVATAAAAIALVATGRLDTGSSDQVIESEVAIAATYELNATPLDPDAVATVDVVPTAAGVEFRLHLMGLDNSEGPDYYTAWLVSADEKIPLGSFHWRKGGVEIVLWSGVDDPAYNRITVTRQTQGDGGASSGEVVLMGDVPDLTSGE